MRWAVGGHRQRPPKGAPPLLPTWTEPRQLGLTGAVRERK
jgi:hypothetical protein